MQVFNVKFYCSLNYIAYIEQRYTCELNKVGYSVAFTYSILRDYTVCSRLSDTRLSIYPHAYVHAINCRYAFNCPRLTVLRSPS